MFSWQITSYHPLKAIVFVNLKIIVFVALMFLLPSIPLILSSRALPLMLSPSPALNARVAFVV